MYILGISAFYHDSAAAILKDGLVLVAAEEERFTRIKHDNEFPIKAIEFCVAEANIKMQDIDCIAYYEKPLLKFERILDNFVSTYPFSLYPFMKGIPEWVGQKIKVEQIIREKLNFKGKLFFIPHHLSHAASTYYSSPFSESAILTIDGVGEYQTTGLWVGENNKIRLLKQIDFPNSLGLLYSTFTAFLGFKVNDDEYKVMGLSGYGKPLYADKIRAIINVDESGGFKINMSFFSFREGFQMWNSKFEEVFGEPRTPNGPVTDREKNIAASIQLVTEEIYLKMLNHLHYITGLKNLCVSGGIGLNALANGKIFKSTPFEKVHIFGPSGDNGSSIGAALFAYMEIIGSNSRAPITDLRIGSHHSNEKIELELKKHKINYRLATDEEELIDTTVQKLSENKIIAWFQGKMEFGPRALGSRSILANPESSIMKSRVNNVKRREEFRPFAGSILENEADKYFHLPHGQSLFPFMNFCFQVRDEKKHKLAAITHIDGTSRIQTLSEKDGLYYKLVKKFHETTGIPCLLNTSFNVKGEPLVESPEQAIKDFLENSIDCLVIGNCIATKSTNKE